MAAGDDKALPPDIISDRELAYLFPGKNIVKVVAPKGDHWLLQVSCFRSLLSGPPATLCLTRYIRSVQDPRVRDGVVKTVADFVDRHLKSDVKSRAAFGFEQLYLH